MCGLLGALALAAVARGADLAEAEKLYNSGKYEACIAMCREAVTPAPPAGVPESELIFLMPPPAPAAGWWVIKARAELAVGKYGDADKSTSSGMEKNDENLTLALLRYKALRMEGSAEAADALLNKVMEMTKATPWRFEQNEQRVALGQFMLIKGTDARVVLETYFDKARKEDPRFVPALMATGNLALEKNDPGVAAESFEAALKVTPDDPDIYFGLARANDDDPELINAALEKALELNPNHADTLLMLTDNLITRERYKDAEDLLAKVVAVNPVEPRAWAYRAVMAHLRGDHKGEEEARGKALSTWKTNPEVDYLIGRKLSQNYRFAVGNDYQRKALASDPNYEPAKFQLSQDLLRMGKEEEGWKLAAEVFKTDPYNVMAFNLVTLHDRIAKFRSLSDDHFLVRMDAKEEPIYGKRVMEILEKARQKLCEKYDVKLEGQTTVEIFPLQQDFEIRTFGWPGEEGFLGVCFGPVVTVNSPASRLSHPTSWEAVVWHEFCHTVTLTKTHNKMPRWISEGISTYEERQANPGWGERMLPEYRELIKKGEVSKISELSRAFSQPPSPMHLQFAYFEASMVVEYFINRFGIEALRGVLTDLGNDVMIGEALTKHSVPMDKLEADFTAWFNKQADELAPKVNWDEPKLMPEDGSEPLTAWNKEHPGSFWGLVFEGEALMLERKFDQARGVLEKARDLFPNYAGIDGPHVLMAKVAQERKDVAEERKALEAFCTLNADAMQPRLRLMELEATDKDWKAVRKRAEEAIGVDPLTPMPYRYLAAATTELGDRAAAIEARRVLLLMDIIDKPEQHFQLGKLLFEEGKLPEARRQVDMALEDAPRYRDGLGLLLKIAEKMDGMVGAETKPSETRP